MRVDPARLSTGRVLLRAPWIALLRPIVQVAAESIWPRPPTSPREVGSIVRSQSRSLASRSHLARPSISPSELFFQRFGIFGGQVCAPGFQECGKLIQPLQEHVAIGEQRRGHLGGRGLHACAEREASTGQFLALMPARGIIRGLEEGGGQKFGQLFHGRDDAVMFKRVRCREVLLPAAPTDCSPIPTRWIWSPGQRQCRRCSL